LKGISIEEGNGLSQERNMKLSEVSLFIKSDLYRYLGKLTFKGFFYHYFLNGAFHYSFWLRMARIRFAPIRIIAKLNHNRLSKKYGIHIPVATQIGYGLYLGHGLGIVVNQTAVLGNNVNLGQFVTIGSNKKRAATIGDNVYIGPNVCIVEDVTIGSNSTIGAGAVVTKDVAENSTVAGVPAKVISEKEPGRFIEQRWSVK